MFSCKFGGLQMYSIHNFSGNKGEVYRKQAERGLACCLPCLEQQNVVRILYRGSTCNHSGYRGSTRDHSVCENRHFHPDYEVRSFKSQNRYFKEEQEPSRNMRGYMVTVVQT